MKALARFLESYGGGLFFCIAIVFVVLDFNIQMKPPQTISKKTMVTYYQELGAETQERQEEDRFEFTSLRFNADISLIMSESPGLKVSFSVDPEKKEESLDDMSLFAVPSFVEGSSQSILRAGFKAVLKSEQLVKETNPIVLIAHPWKLGINSRNLEKDFEVVAHLSKITSP